MQKGYCKLDLHIKSDLLLEYERMLPQSLKTIWSLLCQLLSLIMSYWNVSWDQQKKTDRLNPCFIWSETFNVSRCGGDENTNANANANTNANTNTNKKHKWHIFLYSSGISEQSWIEDYWHAIACLASTSYNHESFKPGEILLGRWLPGGIVILIKMTWYFSKSKSMKTPKGKALKIISQIETDSGEESAPGDSNKPGWSEIIF